jgi:Ca-activated chloride channel family protein
MKPLMVLLAMTWTGLWFTPDQYGRWLFERGDQAKAAAAFADPMWRGVAWYRAGEFKKAAESFARLSTPEAQYNLGNAQVMLGQYDKAIVSYGQALKDRSDWKEAQENLDLAKARAKLVEQKGGDMGDQKLGADQIVFDKDKESDGQETEVAGDQPVSDASVQAMWLRQVQTKPADFLKAKFAYQQAQASEDGGDQ